MTNNLIELNIDNFEAELAKATGPVLIDFWAEWCGPCKQMNPLLEQLAEEVAGQATIAKVNIDESPALAQKFAVLSIPSFLVFKNGALIERQSGVSSKETLKALLS